VNDPTKYGVIAGKQVDQGAYKVERIVEKPSIPPSNLAAVAIYVFNPMIHQAIEKVQPDESGEVQLTDAIQQLIDQECRVYAIELKKDEKRVDIGTPQSYWVALSTTYDRCGARTLV
jgi:dTDP-glucose pyrophosphorylase